MILEYRKMADIERSKQCENKNSNFDLVSCGILKLHEGLLAVFDVFPLFKPMRSKLVSLKYFINKMTLLIPFQRKTT